METNYFRFNSNGYILENTWYKNADGYWYWLKKGGFMSTGWQFINDKWYFFENTGEMKTGWIKYFDKWYYCNENNGDMISRECRNINGTWYYFNENGEMLEQANILVDESGSIHFE